MKGRGCPAAKEHRDVPDLGRFQCVLALSDGAFDVWPRSHTVALSTKDFVDGGHFHHGFRQELGSHCQRVVFSFGPGDVLIFQGGTFVHGSPAVDSETPSPRLVTYASFWPPGTQKGSDHAEGKCECLRWRTCGIKVS